METDVLSSSFCVPFPNIEYTGFEASAIEVRKGRVDCVVNLVGSHPMWNRPTREDSRVEASWIRLAQRENLPQSFFVGVTEVALPSGQSSFEVAFRACVVI